MTTPKTPAELREETPTMAEQKSAVEMLRELREQWRTERNRLTRDGGSLYDTGAASAFHATGLQVDTIVMPALEREQSAHAEEVADLREQVRRLEAERDHYRGPRTEVERLRDELTEATRERERAQAAIEVCDLLDEDTIDDDQYESWSARLAEAQSKYLALRDAQTKPRPLSVEAQSESLARLFPDSTTVVAGRSLKWIGTIQPSDLSREYTIRVTYAEGGTPIARIVGATEMRDGKRPPYLDADGILGLHAPDEWDPSMSIAETIIPWASEWLFFYEGWLATGEWMGGGTQHAQTKADAEAEPEPSPTPADARQMPVVTAAAEAFRLYERVEGRPMSLADCCLFADLLLRRLTEHAPTHAEARPQDVGRTTPASEKEQDDGRIRKSAGGSDLCGRSGREGDLSLSRDGRASGGGPRDERSGREQRHAVDEHDGGDRRVGGAHPGSGGHREREGGLTEGERVMRRPPAPPPLPLDDLAKMSPQDRAKAVESLVARTRDAKWEQQHAPGSDIARKVALLEGRIHALESEHTRAPAPTHADVYRAAREAAAVHVDHKTADAIASAVAAVEMRRV